MVDEYRLGKGRGKKKKVITTWGIHFWSPISTNPNEQGLTLLSGRNMLLSLWYNDSRMNTLLSIFKMRKGIKKGKRISDTAGLGKEEYEDENCYLLW